MKTSIAGKKILLIGGAGFIGHHLALYLKQEGADVSVVDGLNINNLLYLHNTSRHIENRELYIDFVNQRLAALHHAGIPLFVEDVRDYHKVSHVISNVKPQVVVFLAAVAHANRSNKDPYNTFDHSLRTLENALDASRDSIEHFIYFSSSMIYGHFTQGSVTEETPCNPIGIYGALKFAGEKMVISYNQSFGLPYTIVRPSALYGERCISQRVGQIFIENALMGKNITIQGDGHDRLDFTYVADVASGIKNIIEHANSINQTFNLTYGESRSISEMAEIVQKHFPKVTINYTPKDKLMPDRGTLSVEKAKTMIGYSPQHPLERAYLHYIKWYRALFQGRQAEMIQMVKG